MPVENDSRQAPPHRTCGTKLPTTSEHISHHTHSQLGSAIVSEGVIVAMGSDKYRLNWKEFDENTRSYFR